MTKLDDIPRRCDAFDAARKDSNWTRGKSRNQIRATMNKRRRAMKIEKHIKQREAEKAPEAQNQLEKKVDG